MLEAIGYLASVIVAVSLMMSSLLRLRLVNLVGALLFAIYGFAIGALPVAAVNAFIVVVDSYYLVRMLGTKEFFRILEVGADSEYLRYWVERNRAEIQRFIPDFDFRPQADALTFFVLRDLVPAGLFIGERAGGEALQVRLDYVLPGYRDFKVGRFLFREHADFFRDRGIRRLHAHPGNAAHAAYLRRMGFRPTEGGMMECRIA